MSSLDDRIVELAEKYRPLAAKILAGGGMTEFASRVEKGDVYK